MATKFFYAFTLVIRNRKIFMKFLFTSFKTRLRKTYLPKSKVGGSEVHSLKPLNIFTMAGRPADKR